MKYNWKKTISIDWRTLLNYVLIDAISLTAIFLLFMTLGNLLSKKAMSISGGMDPEALKLAILQGTVETNQAFLTNVRSFTLLLFGGVILALILALFIFSASRSYLWKKTFKKFRRWGLLELAVIMLLIPYLIILFIFRLIFNIITASLSDVAFAFTSQLFNALTIIIFLFFFFILHHTFSHKNKVWSSIGESFQLIKKHFKKIILCFFLMIVLGTFLSLLLYFLQTFSTIYPILSTAVFLIYVSLIRIYVVRVVRKEN